MMKKYRGKDIPKKQNDISAVLLTALLPFEEIGVSQMYSALGLETPFCIPDIFCLLISNSQSSELYWFMLLFRPVNLPFCMGFPF